MLRPSIPSTRRMRLSSMTSAPPASAVTNTSNTPEVKPLFSGLSPPAPVMSSRVRLPVRLRADTSRSAMDRLRSIASSSRGGAVLRLTVPGTGSAVT